MFCVGTEVAACSAQCAVCAVCRGQPAQVPCVGSGVQCAEFAGCHLKCTPRSVGRAYQARSVHCTVPSMQCTACAMCRVQSAVWKRSLCSVHSVWCVAWCVCSAMHCVVTSHNTMRTVRAAEPVECLACGVLWKVRGLPGVQSTTRHCVVCTVQNSLWCRVPCTNHASHSAECAVWIVHSGWCAVCKPPLKNTSLVPIKVKTG